MNVGDTVELRIESLAFGADAVARKDGWVIFVQGALPGETVQAQITQRKSSFYKALLKNIVRPSPHRQTSPCAYFPECGGCQYLHLEYSAQIEAKRQQVQDVLERIGKVEFPAIRTVACKEPLHYRNRVKLHVLRSGPELQLGFMNATGRKIVPIEHCMISDPLINNTLAPLREKLKKIPVAKTVTVRANPEGKVDFWTENLPIAKGTTLTERVRDKIFEAPSASFFQVNPPMTEALVNEVEGFLNVDSQVLIDAYCGVGLFSVVFGSKFQQVIGIEQDQDSVRWARKNMRANGLGAGVFYEGRVERLLEKALSNGHGKIITVILDPPRDGCHKDVISNLCKSRPEQIVYVSCNPPTLARDLGRLSSAYKVIGVTLIDMFPQTMHCEVVVNLRPA